MSKALSRPKLMDACERAIVLADKRYSKWTGGVTARFFAPESLVQIVIAECIAKLGANLLLEASVRQIVEKSTGKPPKGDLPNGRIDLAIYYKSKSKLSTPRLLIEVKKVKEKESVNADYKRIVDLMNLCTGFQNGVLVGYIMAVNAETVTRRLQSVRDQTKTKIVRWVEPFNVKGKAGAARFLGAAIYRVDHQ